MTQFDLNASSFANMNVPVLRIPRKGGFFKLQAIK